ncbi:hypothetical protein [Apis mellifera associated microvirus 26]|nr:hypothetical protein [Apis mellifera associated microvirus 26]
MNLIQRNKNETPLRTRSGVHPQNPFKRTKTALEPKPCVRATRVREKWLLGPFSFVKSPSLPPSPSPMCEKILTSSPMCCTKQHNPRRNAA